MGLGSSEQKNGHGGADCDPRIQEAEAAGSGIQGHPQLQEELEASLGYVRAFWERWGFVEKGEEGKNRREGEKL